MVDVLDLRLEILASRQQRNDKLRSEIGPTDLATWLPPLLQLSFKVLSSRLAVVLVCSSERTPSRYHSSRAARLLLSIWLTFSANARLHIPLATLLLCFYRLASRKLISTPHILILDNFTRLSDTDRCIIGRIIFSIFYLLL